MKKISKLKFLLLLNIFVLIVVFSYKVYLNYFEKDFQLINIASIRELEHAKQKNNTISFAVFGNVKNSIDIFDKKIVGDLNNQRDLDFVVSTGNAVLDGAEDKYRMLHRSIKKIKVPVIIGVGGRELSDDGAMRFYKHLGSFYFSFSSGNSYFIFLDTTKSLSIEGQKEWLIKELKNASGYRHKFVFMSKPPFVFEEKSFLEIEEGYIENKDQRDFLTGVFSKHKVTAVFSTMPGIFHGREIGGVMYYVTGGAGGSLILNNDNSFYHYLRVEVAPNGVSYSVIRQAESLNHVYYQFFENIWVFLHSMFYANFLDIVFILSFMALIILIVYIKASKEIDYYREFDEELPDISGNKKLNIAMFTNDYLPFIGGVPISISRLAKGLRKQGHNVIVFAPEYPRSSPEEEMGYVVRCKLLAYYKTGQFNFPIVNIFSPRIKKEFLKYKFDLIHVHHPFWMGSKGLSLGKRYGIPVVLTYHTRLEEYAHCLPVLKLVFKNIISHRMIRRFAQKCDLVIAPTNSAKEYLSNIGVSRNKAILPTGIDLTSYGSVTKSDLEMVRKECRGNNEILLCSVSRLSKEKNSSFLIEGIKYIKDHTGISFRVVIIGDGPERGNIEKQIERDDLSEYIKLTGAMKPEEVFKYYIESDIFIFSSQSETQGMVLLEAMGGGCAVVAIRASGIDDMIEEEYNGFKTKADIECWAKKVIDLMENREELEKIKYNAREFASKFVEELISQRVEKEYIKSIKQYKQFFNSDEKNHDKEVLL